MKKVKWTTKGRNIWSVNEYNKMQSHGFHVITLALSVHNKTTHFKLMLRRDFDTSVKIHDFYQEEQAMKLELENHPDFVATGREI